MKQNATLKYMKIGEHLWSSKITCFSEMIHWRRVETWRRFRKHYIFTLLS